MTDATKTPERSRYPHHDPQQVVVQASVRLPVEAFEQFTPEQTEAIMRGVAQVLVAAQQQRKDSPDGD